MISNSANEIFVLNRLNGTLALNKLNDRYRKLIEGKPGLFFFELIIHKTNKGEIFGTKSAPERKVNRIFCLY